MSGQIPPAADTVIVGAGHNGLVCAFYLARAGQSVVLLERRSIVGGACVTEELTPGARYSTCANILWQLQPRIELEMDLRRHGLRDKRVQGSVALFPDRERITLTRDLEQVAAEVGRLNPRDGRRLADWKDFWHRAASLLHPYALRDAPSLDELRVHAHRTGNAEVLETLLTDTTQQICDRFFEDERVKAAFANVEDVGAWVPGSALVAAWWHTGALTRAGGSFVEGGMGGLTQAMLRAAESAGAVVVTDADVASIGRNDHGVCGVEMVDGRRIEARVIVSNADPKRTFGRLVADPDGSVAGSARVDAWQTNISYQKFHGLVRELPDLREYFDGDQPPTHLRAVLKIIPTLRGYREAFEAAKAGELPATPIVGGMFIPSLLDPTLAPAGHHTVSAWILYAPGRLASGTWEAAREEAAKRFIARVGEFVPNFAESLVEWKMLLPPDFEELHGMTDGNIRHLDVRPGQFLSDRPRPGWGHRSPIKGLYLCGAGTHPGGEVTGANGYNAARAVLEDTPSR